MIAVVHLVWGPLGPEPLRRFLASYRGHPAGAEHELIVLFNGVDDDQRPALEAELNAVAHRKLELKEPVQDLVAYRQAAARLEHERLCFLNSHSEILSPGWLAELSAALDVRGVGIVGATGSWASHRSGVLNGLFLPNPYRRVIPERRVAREQLLAMELEREGVEAAPSDAPPRRSFGGSVLATLRTLPLMPEQLIRFPGFPAPHLRTNAFMLSRATFADLRIGRVARKMDAYSLESGYNSFTRQAHRMGLQTLVVDRQGRSYEHERWPDSCTLWQGDQEGLLVADNQTRSYANGGIERRQLLSVFAWGAQARPRMPAEAKAS